MSFGLKSLLFTLCLTCVFIAQAAELKTQEQRFSYALGIQFGQNLKSQNINVDGAAFTAAIVDVMQGNELQLTPQEMTQAMQMAQQAVVKAREERGQAALDAGKKFLEENKKKDGVVVLPSGLQYIELAAGEGDSPKENAKVTVHYKGTLINGTEFDSSYKRGKPTSFRLGGVVKGFREALSRMSAGANWQVFMPSDLAYGPRGAGNKIGPNETLIFDLKLISFENPAKTEKSEKVEKAEP